jgi:hypothetical protein
MSIASPVLSLVVFWVVVSFSMALVIHKVFDITSHECLHENDGAKTSRQRRPSLAAQPWGGLIVGPQFCYVHVEGFAQKQQSEGMFRWLASSFALASYVGWQPEYACYWPASHASLAASCAVFSFLLVVCTHHNGKCTLATTWKRG